MQSFTRARGPLPLVLLGTFIAIVMWTRARHMTNSTHVHAPPTIGAEAVVPKTECTHIITRDVAFPRDRCWIMGLAVGLDLTTLYRFVSTARLACRRCPIHLFIHAPIDMVDHRALATAYGPLIWHEWSTMRASKTLPIATQRYLAYRLLLQSLDKPDRPSAVFLTDVRDAFFQPADLFAPLDRLGPGLHVFEEEPNSYATSIRTEPYNAKWIRDCYGESVLEQFWHHRVLCSGTTMASFDHALLYLDAMTNHAENQCGMQPDVGTDQGMHNVIVYSHEVPNTFIHTNRDGPVYTVGYVSSIKRDRFGTILRPEGPIPAVVHQVDRFGKLSQWLDAHFSLVPVNALDISKA